MSPLHMDRLIITRDPSQILVTLTTAGNWHDATRHCNEHGFAPYVIQFEIVGYYTMVLMRMPADAHQDFKGRGFL